MKLNFNFKLLLFFALAISNDHQLVAQTSSKEVKYLEQKLAEAKDDTTKQYYHFRLVWETFQEPKKFVHHFTEGGILIGNNWSAKEGLFYPSFMQDSIEGIRRELKVAIARYHKVNDKRREVQCIYLLACFTEDPNIQFKYLKEAQELVAKEKDLKRKEMGMATIELALMNCNFTGNDPSLNIPKAKKLMTKFFKQGDSLYAYTIMGGISAAYSYLEKPDSAIYYSTLKFNYLLKEKIRKEFLLGTAQELLLFTGQLGMFDLCRYYAKYCLANLDTTDKYVFLSTSVYLKLALYYMNVEASAEDFSLKKAQEYLERARILTSKKKSWQRQNSIHRIDYYAYLAEWAKLSGDYKLAFESAYNQMFLLDSIKTIKNVENFNEMQVKYEVAQKEKDTIIAQQKSKLQLTWFISIVFLITLIAIGLFFYMRNRNKIKTLEESIKIRNTISANLHDDVGSALSSISIISDMVKSVVTKNPEKANELIDKISETSNEVMSNMKDIVWSINPNNDHVENLLAKMREFAANVLENGKIEMIYNDQTAGKAKIDVVNRPEVYLIFKEAINNVAKYAKASLVEINLYNTAEHFCIEIFDNGIGFDKDKVEMGNGLINMHKRAEKIGAKFTLQSEINIGTKINLIV
jgi:signal transduction histidine kinase